MHLCMCVRVCVQVFVCVSDRERVSRRQFDIATPSSKNALSSSHFDDLRECSSNNFERQQSWTRVRNEIITHGKSGWSWYVIV